VGDPLCARRAPSASATREGMFVQLFGGREKK
jgi:hypothetical protein